ncbi:MAG: type II toxin-antitoxin system VapC family toxin [Sulfuricaulis sp.]
MGGLESVIMLDTHVLTWWVNGGGELTKGARRAIEQEGKAEAGVIMVSAISAWEIAMLVNKGRLVLSMDVQSWLQTVMKIPYVRFIPVDNDIALKSTMLPEPFHKDPADRMIVATARALAVPLVTSDGNIQAYPHVKTIW